MTHETYKTFFVAKTLIYLKTEFLLFHSFFPKEDQTQICAPDVYSPSMRVI